MTSRRRFVLAALGALPFVGCGTISQWWQTFEQNPAAAVSELVTYVGGLVQTAEAIFAEILPLLGASGAQASADFNALVLTVQDASSALQDAVQVAIQAKQPSPDWGSLVAALQDAVAKLFAAVAAWQGAAQPPAERRARLSSHFQLLARQAATVARWRH
jgi:hypothetical protein